MSNSNYDLPPEWADQSGVMLTWPHADSAWAPFLPRVEKEFVEIAKHIATYEKVLITCFSQEHQAHIEHLLSTANLPSSQIRYFIAPSDDTWVRDHGPITVFNNDGPQLLDFTFNGWGNKFSATRDNAVSQHLYRLGAFGDNPFTTLPWVLEGGSIEVDGHGSLLTTERCLLAPTRNPQLNKEALEQHLQQWFNVNRVLWLKHGYLAGDDTDSHIDTLARYTDAKTICYVACDDPQDEHYAELSAMEKELRAFKDYQGNPYRLVPLPWPEAKFSDDGDRLPASYANFLIINGAVLVPTYEDAADSKALAQIQTCFPDRKVIGISCRTLIEQYGSLHCVTMQLPAGVIREHI